jgi:hypothetical protein
MVIALFTKGNHKISWGIPWKTMGHPSNAMDVMGLHGDFPWCPIKCHGHHGTSWGFPLAPREIIKFHGVSHGKPWDTHQMPWTSWGFMGISLGVPSNAMDTMGLHGDFHWHQGKSENFMGYPMENHGALQQVMGNPQYAMGIIWDAMGITIVAMGNPINPWGIKWKT